MSDQLDHAKIEEMPLPNGVWESGQSLPPLDPGVLSAIDAPPREVMQRAADRGMDRLAVADIDPNNLAEAGWGIIFAADADPSVRKALLPLIEHRSRNVRSDRLFRIFEASKGYQRNDTVRSWLAKNNVSLAVVDPEQGMPLYLTIVGPPTAIPFEFQYLLDTYWCVGRLHFDSAEDYGTYARHVIAYEEAKILQQRRALAIFAPKNPGDRATGLLHDLVAHPLVNGNTIVRALGPRQGFGVTPLLGADATKANLQALLRGELGGVPALLFSGSHGLAVACDAPHQIERQGAIVCQDWKGGPITPNMTYAAADLDPAVALGGLLYFFFACYSGGCPAFDDYRRDPQGRPVKIASAPFVGRLPQRLLLSGALAVLAHIDRAWSYSFKSGRSAPHVQEIRDVMVRILKGERIGQATDQFNLRWAVLSSELADTLRSRDFDSGRVSDAILANRWVARNDARNYIVFGDPAVRLRVEALVR
jgi:hypothetical protein